MVSSAARAQQDPSLVLLGHAGLDCFGHVGALERLHATATCASCRALDVLHLHLLPGPSGLTVSTKHELIQESQQDLS